MYLMLSDLFGNINQEKSSLIRFESFFEYDLNLFLKFESQIITIAFREGDTPSLKEKFSLW